VYPTQPNPWVNPTHGQLCGVLAETVYTGRFARVRHPVIDKMHMSYITSHSLSAHFCAVIAIYTL